MKSDLVRISKFLSYVLRHRPETVGLVLDEAGWAPIDDVIRGAVAAGYPLSRELLLEVVETNDKNRFAIDEPGERIRASQGHSVKVRLGLSPIEPPETLYHGTATRLLESILGRGLERRKRHHVHLSPDPETARKVGSRHGTPVVLEVDAAAMHADGHEFFLSENGVWLTEHVPPRYLRAPA
ncbi:MAG: RNA 2'-phosphotransferase [Planctomycetota bacterium]|nr:RNA 2'-phosphotransferase [Planctomycetota bacterium]